MLQAHGIAAARDHACVAAEEFGFCRRYAENGFDALVVRRHGVGGKIGEAEVLRPMLEHMRRCAIAGSGIDGGAATDGATDGNWNRRVANRNRCGTAAVHLGLHVEWPAVERRAIDIVASFDEDDRDASFGQFLADDRAACASADDHDIAFDRDVGIEIERGVHARLAPLRQRFALRFLKGVDAAELLVDIRIIEVRGFERRGQPAQQRAARDAAAT